MADFARVDWDALRAAARKCRQLTREIEQGRPNGDLLHSVHKLGMFMGEALPQAWAAALDEVPDAAP